LQKLHWKGGNNISWFVEENTILIFLSVKEQTRCSCQSYPVWRSYWSSSPSRSVTSQGSRATCVTATLRTAVERSLSRTGSRRAPAPPAPSSTAEWAVGVLRLPEAVRQRLVSTATPWTSATCSVSVPAWRISAIQRLKFAVESNCGSRWSSLSSAYSLLSLNFVTEMAEM